MVDLVELVRCGDSDSLRRFVPSRHDVNAQINGADLCFLTHAAAVYGKSEILLYLIESGADLERKAPDGYSAAHWAAYGGWPDILQILSENGADMAVSDDNGQTPLHVASARGHFNAVEALINMSVPINAVADFRWTPLHFAVAYGHRKIVKLLIDSGASLEQKDSLGRSVEILSSEYDRTWFSDIIKHR